MPSTYPGAVDDFGVPSTPATTPLASAGDASPARAHTELHEDLGDAVVATETELDAAKADIASLQADVATLQSDLDAAEAVNVTQQPWYASPNIQVPQSAQVGTWAIAFSSNRVLRANAAGAADGDYAQWDVLLSAGTWQLDVVYLSATSAGIMQAQIDGTNVGSTVDTYAAAGVADNLHTVTGIAVATAGLHTLKLLVSGKNASSSNYILRIQAVALRRTA